MATHLDFAWLAAMLRTRRRALVALDDGTLLFDRVNLLEPGHVTIGDRRVPLGRIASISRRAAMNVGHA